MTPPDSQRLVVDLQLSPAGGDWGRLREASVAAEEAGYGALWVFDHLAGRSLRGDDMLECFTWLGALAVATRRIALGSLVANVWNREPGVLAVAAASVERISGRQLFVGIGAGTSPTSTFAGEQLAVGADIRASMVERHDRVERTLDLLARMWRPDRSPEFDTFPLPRTRPVTVVGVNSARLARIAGRSADGINVWWGHPRRDELVAAAREARAGVVGEVSPLLVTVYEWWDEALLDPTSDARVEMAERGVDRLVVVDLRPADPALIARTRP